MHFAGTVQGVGFRYTTVHVANRHDVTGTVRNLPDGRVECVVEGDAAEIDAFLADLSQAMSGYIRRTTQQTAPHSGRFANFSVSF